jgi:TPR repeat protein
MTRSAQVDTKGLSYEDVLTKADIGDVECLYQSGLMHHYGQGVAQDAKRAFNDCFAAAEKGHAAAQAYVAYCCHSGSLAVRRNYRKAFYWYTLSAEQGYRSAQFSLACMHLYAKGTHKNLGRAACWYKLAAQQGCADSCFQLSRAYRIGKGVSKNIPISIEYLQKAAQGDVPGAQYLLGLEYLAGAHIRGDVDEGVKWLEIAADKSHKEAEKLLSELLSFQILNAKLAYVCGLPRDSLLPLRLKTLIRLEQTEIPLFAEMADDLRDFVTLNPKAGFHFLEDVAKMTTQAALVAHENDEEVEACRYETRAKHLTS